MLKFEGFINTEHKKTGETDQKWFTVKALSEAEAKAKIRKRFQAKKNLKVFGIKLEYVYLV